MAKMPPLPNNKIVNIDTIRDKKNLAIKDPDGFFQLAFYKKSSDFLDPKEFGKFIKAVEKMVRQSDEYKAYIAYLKNDIGLDHCMLLGKVNDEKATIEMHHGPILTLFDYCAIILEWMLVNEKKVTTFAVTKRVLKAHFDNRVQVVMLCKTGHDLMGSGRGFLHPKQAWGDINGFMAQYGDGVSAEMRDTFNEFIDMAEKHKTTDNDLLAVDGIKSWKDKGRKKNGSNP